MQPADHGLVAGGVNYMSVDSAGSVAVSVDSLGSVIMQQIGPGNDSSPSEFSAVMPSQSPVADAPDSAAEACQVSCAAELPCSALTLMGEC